MIVGLDFLEWWALNKFMLFSLGDIPGSTLYTHISGVAVEIYVPGLEDSLKTQWLTRTGLFSCYYLPVPNNFGYLSKE